jgi:hypothetical protein
MRFSSVPNGIKWDVDTLSTRIANANKNRPAVLGRALTAVAETWKGYMVVRTPVQFGALRASEIVSEVKIDGRIISVDIDAGGPAAGYAVFVHEDLDARHPVGQAKFIESVIMEQGPFMNKQLGAAIRWEDLF